MKTIKTAIGIKRYQFSHHHFFKILKNQEIPIQQRLKFLPNLAHFIMSFADLNKYVLPFNFPQNKYEEVINVHRNKILIIGLGICMT
ncbi:hypothetical protein [Acinetobacter sp. ANC5681]|uniref:hypothetical protein n=1 Tax=Acinetobacter sp. ANC5681 TaxID=2929504 RepID=UPI00201AD05D|nr:hypothetical protein [Acinetobacter sp. ANC5681]MCL5768821.1 hypothetical protein [Acinetobacter sp. ANC5681]